MYSLTAVEGKDQNPFHGAEIKVSRGPHSHRDMGEGSLNLQLPGAPGHPTPSTPVGTLLSVLFLLQDPWDGI